MSFDAGKEKEAIQKGVVCIQEFMKMEQIQEMKTNNYEEYEKLMKGTFPTFASSFECLFEMIIRGDNMDTLNMMLSKFVQIHNGDIDKDKGELAIGEHIAKQYNADGQQGPRVTTGSSSHKTHKKGSGRKGRR
jgi:hypothetical protein